MTLNDEMYWPEGESDWEAMDDAEFVRYLDSEQSLGKSFEEYLLNRTFGTIEI